MQPAGISKSGTELQSKIDRKNEEIGILKIGLSGITQRYGYKNVQEFYRIYHKSHSAYAVYREQEAEWEQDYQKETDRQHTERIYHSKDKGAR